MIALLERFTRPKEGGGFAVADDTFGSRLRQLREKASLTQEQLAGKVGMHKLSISKLELDKSEPSWPTVRALAKALGVSCSAFEDTIDTPPPEERQPGKRGRPPKAKPAEPVDE